MIAYYIPHQINILNQNPGAHFSPYQDVLVCELVRLVEIIRNFFFFFFFKNFKANTLFTKITQTSTMTISRYQHSKLTKWKDAHQIKC